MSDLKVTRLNPALRICLNCGDTFYGEECDRCGSNNFRAITEKDQINFAREQRGEIASWKEPN